MLDENDIYLNVFNFNKKTWSNILNIQVHVYIE